jgi:hypothetical protein
MKLKIFLALTLVLGMAVSFVLPAKADSEIGDQLERVKAAITKYHSTKLAMAAGYNFVPGLDGCFSNPGVGGMGYHLINTSLLDNVINPLKPEALVYAPHPGGRLELVAVEYIVPIAGWDAVHSSPPTQFGQTYERNTTLGVYSLHAWLFKHNSLGIFNDWNPKVTCP